MRTFNEKYFIVLPDKIRYIENCIRSKIPINFIAILQIVSGADRTRIAKRFHFLFNRNVWEYFSETEMNEDNLDYFSNKVNWVKITARVVESLNSRNGNDKIFSEEFIGRNLGKLQQQTIIKECRLSNGFIKKYSENLDLYAVASYQNVTSKTIKLLKLNPIPLIRNKHVKALDKDCFPAANWVKILSGFNGMTVGMLSKLAFLKDDFTLLKIILDNPSNSSDLKDLTIDTVVSIFK